MERIVFKFASVACCVALVGCSSSNPNVTGSGVASSEERTLSPFSAVEVYGVGSLTVSPGEELKLTIEADDNMLQYVKSSVDSQKLRVGVGPGTYVWNAGYPRMTLRRANATTYALSGQTQLNLDQVDLDELTVRLDGQCNARLNGQIGKLNIDLSGQSSIDATNATIVSIPGKMVGQCKITCQDGADVKVDANRDSVVTKVSSN